MLARSRAAVLVLGCSLLAALGGCAAIGFDPLEDSVNPLPETGGSGGGSGSSGSSGSGSTGGQSGTGLGGQGGQSGVGGQGGQSGSGAGGNSGDGGQGGSGGMNMRVDGGMPDGGPPPVNPCAGKPNGELCDDGFYCTLEYCWLGECVITDRDCSNECNTGVCHEDTKECVFTPRSNDTECGSPPVKCEDGVCPAPAMQCTVECSPTCMMDECAYDCAMVNSCAPTCANGNDCQVDCTGTVECKLDCLDSECDMQCQQSGTCEVLCSGDTAICSVTCTDASGCENNRCVDGASCLLICLEDAQDCGFKECWDNSDRTCPDGSITCNHDCPGE